MNVNEQAVVTLLEKHVLLVSEKQQWLSAVRHQYRFALATPATRPLPSLSNRRSSLLKNLRVGFKLNSESKKRREVSLVELLSMRSPSVGLVVLSQR